MIFSVEGMDNRLSTLSTKWVAFDNSRPFLMSVVNTGLLLTVYILLDRILSGPFTRLPESAYYQPAIFLSVIKTVITEPVLLVLALLTTGIVIYRWSVFTTTWKGIEFPGGLRIFAVIVSIVMSFACATYDFNLLLDQYHHLDRLLLVLMIPLIYWRPIFLVPYIILATAYIAQYSLVIGGYSWAQFSMLKGLLLLVISTLVLRSVIQRNWTVEFLLIAVCFIASHYWIAGFGKYELDWHHLNEIQRLLPNTYGNGWLPFLNVSEVSAIARDLATFNIPLRVGTLVLEWGVLFVLWRRTSLQVFLICWIIFHCSVFATSGIFFWKWILLELSLLVVLRFLPEKLLSDLFTSKNFLLSILLIASSVFWSGATKLAWLEMPMSYVYRFKAITQDGKTYDLPPAFFSPYDYQFSLGNFSYLSNHPTLPIVWGGCHCPELLEFANEARSPQDVLDLELHHGVIRYDAAMVEQFDRFIQQFAGSYNRNGGKPGLYESVKAPRQIWTFPHNTNMPDGSVIQQISVQQVLTFFDDQKYAEIAVRETRKVIIQ